MKADTRSSKLKETINRPKAGISINTVLAELGNVSRRDVSIVGEETKTYSQRHFEGRHLWLSRHRKGESDKKRNIETVTERGMKKEKQTDK